MDETRQAANTGMGEGLHDTAETARDLAHTLERGADALEDASHAVDAVGQRVERVTHAAGRARDVITSNTRGHPMAALATAFTIGFVAGRTMG